MNVIIISNNRKDVVKLIKKYYKTDAVFFLYSDSSEFHSEAKEISITFVVKINVNFYTNYDNVEKILKKELDWTHYGGHHHESLLTKFVVSSYLPKKFNIDRRMTSLSAMIRSNKISKVAAKKILQTKPETSDENRLKDYILGKLDITTEEYEISFNQKNKNFKDFKTYYNFFKYFKYPVKALYKMNFIPKLLYLRYFGSGY